MYWKDFLKLKTNNNVDTTQTTTHIGLCAGYGGIELGLKRVIPDLRSIALCEIEAFACANLVAKMEAGLMDAAPIWSDLKTFPWAEFRGKVDILTGGYPCQPFSAAGKRAGKDDPRHLWPWIADGIRLLQPGMCFFENVEGHISLGLSTVISDLEEMGYRTTWGIFSASEVGAPHQRKRVFILAYDDRQRGTQYSLPFAIQTQLASAHSKGFGGNVWPSRPGEPQYDWEPPRVVADGKKHGWAYQRVTGDLDCETGSEAGRRDQPASPTSDCGDAGTKTMGNTTQLFSNGGDDHRGVSKQSEKVSKPRDPSWEGVGDTNGTGSQEWTGQRGAGVQRAYADGQADAERQTESSMGRDADGPADRLDDAKLYTTCDNRTDELRLLGNGVVPATAEKAFRTLMQTLHE